MNAFALARQSSEPRFLQLTLPRQSQNYPPNYVSKTVQARRSVPLPSQRPEYGNESRPVSYPSRPIPMGGKVSQALWRRINHGLTRRQLQDAIKVSDGTIDNLLSGKSDPSARVLAALLQFMDAGFANEVLGHLGLVVSKPTEAAKKIHAALIEIASTDEIAAETYLDFIQQSQSQQRGFK